MSRFVVTVVALLALGVGPLTADGAAAASRVRVLERKPDPHGSPRPARDAEHVPLRTSFYVELEVATKEGEDEIMPESVSIRLEPQGGEPVELLRPGSRFPPGGRGWLRPKQGRQEADYSSVKLLAVYVEPGEPLKPATKYTATVSARSRSGAELAAGGGATWTFTTESAAKPDPVKFTLDLSAKPVRWRGAFFSGICNVLFCTNERTFGPTYELMAEARKQHPRAWSYQRDFWMTGMEFRKPGLFSHSLPNIVRERETRRITKIEEREDGVLLRVEDFFGHQQYGIPSNRPLSEDYQADDEVLIADGISDARAKVASVDDAQRTVLVSPFPTPAQGWKIDYEGPLPKKEDPNAPGLFPPGGCYLRKFKPHGTACYYWGRLDKEWDLVHGRYGRRVLVNFADAAGDLSIDGRSWTTAKDLAQWHEVTRVITGHLIERYGDAALTFTWSVFNEPDLGPYFWRTDWDELQRFYDYTTDGILRAFEDSGYDSSRVFIGGLELGGIFGVHLKLTEFLAHCSPTASAKGALPTNAAFADKRLDGKRSRRVEELCRANSGKGTPCDFVSIHSYNRSEVMAAKLIRAKEMALEIDPTYYKDLWVNSHEACPEWSLPPDEAASDSYLGNGYFSSWCMDVAGRQLRQAATDPRYGFGETLLTVWPPRQNFTGINAVTRIINVDDNGDGRTDRRETIPNQAFHAMTLLSDLHDRFWILPEQKVGGHDVAGFASRDDAGVTRVVLYTHHAQDTQSRSDAEFDVALDVKGLAGDGDIRVREYRFDRQHNSYFSDAKRLRDKRAPADKKSDGTNLAAALQALESDDPAARKAAAETLNAASPAALMEVAEAAFQLAERTKDQAVRDALQMAFAKLIEGGSDNYPAEDFNRVRQLSELRPTGTSTLSRQADGGLGLTVRVGGNGVNVVVIEPNR